LDKNFIISKLAEAIDQSKGDEGRNQYLLERLRGDREIINSDKLYLEKILELKIHNIYDESIKEKIIIQKKDNTVFLNPKMIKCNSCEKEINLNEKSLRFQNNWYHELCAKPILEKIRPKISKNIEIQKIN
jgi:hypothetical protein